MSRLVVLGNGHLLSGWEEPTVLAGGAVAWEGARIVAVGPEVDVLRTHPGALYLDAGGGLITPGMVNLHTHFYSALARGLNPGTPLRNFPEILDRLWWRLDRALEFLPSDDELLEATRLVSLHYIYEAETACGSCGVGAPGELCDAQKEFDEGQALWNSDPVEAARKFKDATRSAQRAIVQCP